MHRYHNAIRVSVCAIAAAGAAFAQTVVLRNPNYHRPTDKPDTLDYGRMVRTVVGLEAVVRTLSDAN